MSNHWESHIGSEPLLSDTDGDGIPDGLEVNLKTQTLYDRDKDGRPDILDVDDDGDGIPSVYEGRLDSDKDGTANYLDLDSDNDGVADKDEILLTFKDEDHDRLDDRFDADIQLGSDENGDGILDHMTFADVNKNGVPDFLDQSVKVSQNSKPEKVRAVKSSRQSALLAETMPDSPSKLKQPLLEEKLTKSSQANKLSEPSKLPKVISKTEDTDSDGLKNELELVLGLNPESADTDGDGVPDELEVGINQNKPQDSDLDGLIDALDKDDDNDGILTKLEVQVSSKLGYKLDTDQDGVFNYLDANDDGDSRLSKLEGTSSDFDGDGLADYLDASDGVSKAIDSKVVILYDKSLRSAENTQSGQEERAAAIKVVASE